MKTREKKRWYFYAIIYQNQKVIDSNRVCKAPELTSNYKRLINEFNKGFIDGYGYTNDFKTL
jgi:hypothetical protein